MFSSGREDSISLNELTQLVSESEIASFYLGITTIPCVIQSPLRTDSHPSLGIFSVDGIHVYYTDLATKENGSIFQLLSKWWNLSFTNTIGKIHKEITTGTKVSISALKHISINTLNSDKNSILECKVREWKPHDLEYWGAYGISKEWLDYAEILPISHKIIISNGNRYVFGVDKYAYAYVERKEGKVTLKIYQPKNKLGYKWCNKHDRSVISLWTKLPPTGKRIVICSSMKDALCLWANTGIPSIAIQGEGYIISNTVIEELKRRFQRQYICLDNDKAGLENAIRLSEQTGFTNLVLPQFQGGKDISDMYKVLGRTVFLQTFKTLFNDTK